MRVVRVLMALFVAMIGACSGASAPLAARSAQLPSVERAPCPAAIARVPGVRCQRVVVPERRDRRTDHHVRLFVTVLPSRAKPVHEPVLVLQGGPGDTPDLAS